MPGEEKPHRFLMSVVPPLRGIAYPPAPSPTGTGVDFDGQLYEGVEGFVVVADSKTGKVVVMRGKSAPENFGPA